MIEKSFSWAKARGLTRDNPVHGEEEARLVLEDGFQHDDERGEMRHLKGEGHLEDADGALLSAPEGMELSEGAGPEATGASDPKSEQAAAAAAAAASGLDELLRSPGLEGHSYTTRLLTTLLPSNWYAKKDASINAILQALAHDLTQLLDVGITVEAGW
ncbi:Uncharacterized protein SCF082_LOCUS37667 [Durusdinium trenchii]|uniref:Uncharacterized protein n=1 Tax=Durusdinium trenchii TaxID=1381693 RepID=A0ABP0PS77_9DINO